MESMTVYWIGSQYGKQSSSVHHTPYFSVKDSRALMVVCCDQVIAALRWHVKSRGCQDLGEKLPMSLFVISHTVQGNVEVALVKPAACRVPSISQTRGTSTPHADLPEGKAKVFVKVTPFQRASKSSTMSLNE